jgi:hypothetical protein
MQSLVKCALVLITWVFLFGGIASGGEKPFFDMQGCDLCKVFMEDPKLMANVKWEQYEISNGVVSVTSVKGEILPSYRAAHAKMMKLIERLEQGDSLNLCGHCQAIGELTERGMVYDYIETPTGDISIMHASDPQVVADIKALSTKAKEEMKKMEMMKKEEMKHKGHKHD